MTEKNPTTPFAMAERMRVLAFPEAVIFDMTGVEAPDVSESFDTEPLEVSVDAEEAEASIEA
jgi:hypothetical protein